MRAALKIQLVQRCCLHHAKLHFLIGSLGLGSIQMYSTGGQSRNHILFKCRRQLFADQHVCELSNSNLRPKSQQKQCECFVSGLLQLFPFLHLLHPTVLQFLHGCLLVAGDLAVSVKDQGLADWICALD